MGRDWSHGALVEIPPFDGLPPLNRPPVGETSSHYTEFVFSPAAHPIFSCLALKPHDGQADSTFSLHYAAGDSVRGDSCRGSLATYHCAYLPHTVSSHSHRSGTNCFPCTSCQPGRTTQLFGEPIRCPVWKTLTWIRRSQLAAYV